MYSYGKINQEQLRQSSLKRGGNVMTICLQRLNSGTSQLESEMRQAIDHPPSRKLPGTVYSLHCLKMKKLKYWKWQVNC